MMSISNEIAMLACLVVKPQTMISRLLILALVSPCENPWNAAFDMHS